MDRRRILALLCAVAAPVLSARGAGAGAVGEFRCVYAVTEETVPAAAPQQPAAPGAGTAAGAGAGASPRKVIETFRLTLGVADDYLTEQRDQSPQTLVIHFPTRRVYALDHASKTYRESSLHAHVAFRVNELINRLAAGAGLRASKQTGAAWEPPPGVSAAIAARALDPFRAESLFGLRLPKGTPWTESPAATPVAAGKGWEFLYQGEVVAKFTPSDRPVPAALRRGLLRFLVHRCQIHPTVRDRLTDSGVWPESLVFQTTDLTAEKAVTLKFVSAAAAGAVGGWAGIPSGFTPRFDPDDPLDRVLRKARDCRAAAPASPPEAALAALNRHVDRALDRNQVLDAYLAWYEYNARTGDAAAAVAERIRATKSPQLQDFLRPEPADVTGLERKLREIDAIDRGGLTFGHILDVFCGAHLTLLNRPAEANARFLKALEANPLLTSVYVLLGTNHFRAMATEDAWRCFDAARRLNPESPSLADVTALETRFERDFPEAF